LKPQRGVIQKVVNTRYLFVRGHAFRPIIGESPTV
jgi:hypothetical protein